AGCIGGRIEYEGGPFRPVLHWRNGRAAEGSGLENRQGFTPFVGSNPTSSVAQLFERSQVWRDGREAEGTGLLNLHIRKGIEGSNLSLSVALGRVSDPPTVLRAGHAESRRGPNRAGEPAAPRPRAPRVRPPRPLHR